MQESNPYAPPRSKVLDRPIEGGVWRQGKSLVMQIDAELPDRCIYCNEPTRLNKRRRIYYLNFWLQLILVLLFVAFNVIALLPILVVALIFRKSVVVDIPICEKHWRRRIYLTMTTLFMLVATVVVAMMSVNIIAMREVLFNLSMVLFGVSIVLAIVTGRIMRAKKINKDVAIFRGPGKPFLGSLPEYSDQQQ